MQVNTELDEAKELFVNKKVIVMVNAIKIQVRN